MRIISGNTFNPGATDKTYEGVGPCESLDIYKKCSKCRREKELDAFAPIVKLYNRKDGSISIYSLRRNKCRACTWGNSKYSKYIKKKDRL